MAIIGLVSSTRFAVDGSLYPRVYTGHPHWPWPLTTGSGNVAGTDWTPVFETDA